MTTTRGSKAAPKLAAVKDGEVMLPESTAITLESGTQVEVLPLKSRQLLKMLKIVTHGAGDSLLALRMDANDSDGAFATKMMMTLAFSIPEAEDETIDFVNSMVKPVGLVERRPLSDEDKERNVALWGTVLHDLENPELLDLMAIIETVVKNETPNLKALGKKFNQMFSLVNLTEKTTKSQSTSTE